MKKIGDVEFLGALQKSQSIRQLLHNLGYRTNSGAMFYAAKNRIKNQNLDTSHFSKKKHHAYAPLEDILKENSLFSRFHLKKKLIAGGVLAYKCAICLLVEWNGKPIVLQLDHIDGNPTNNKINNLRLLCPNCHSQTPNYGGRNTIKKKVKEKTV